MRHASVLDVYGTPTVRALLDAAGLSAILAAYVKLRWHDVEPGSVFGLRARDGSDAGLRCEAFPLGTGRVPRYASRYAREFDQGRLLTTVVAYRVSDTGCGASALVMPTAPRIPAGLLRRSDDIVVLDGTFWAEEELGLPGRGATDLGHVPLDGSSGTLAVVRQLQQSGQRRPRVVYTHFNNTNPVLADTEQRRMLISAGAEVAHDGMEISLRGNGHGGRTEQA
jgi:pyrroloquinoline quinone biosynthesis protein B